MSNDVKKIYLCRPNLSPICQLNGVEVDSVSINTHVKDFDVLTFTVDRYVNVNGNYIQSNGYELLDVAMYYHVEDYGYFRSEYPLLRNDGDFEKKEITAYSIEKEVFNVDWVNLKINTAEQDSQEMLIEGNVTGYAMPIQLISFYNPYDERFSLLNILISKIPLWSIGYVDPYIYCRRDEDGNFIQSVKKSPVGEDIPQTFSYSGKRWIYNDDGAFEQEQGSWVEPKYDLKAVGIYNEENISIYAFLTSRLGPKIGALFFFDTERRVIHAISKYTLENRQSKYDTGIYVGFRNLVNSVDLQVDEDSVFTRVNCAGDGDLTFLDLNYGSTRLIDLTYFAHEPFMTEETAAKVLAWQKLIDDKRPEYKVLAAQAIELNEQINEITYKVPSDDDYWKQWDGMNEEALRKSLAYYQAELAMLQESVDDTPRYDSSGKYIPYNQGKTDNWYGSKLALEHRGYGGYGTYYEITTYIIPNIRIALNNLTLLTIDPNYMEPIEQVDYDWDLYGIVELENQIKNLENQYRILKDEYGNTWPDGDSELANQIMGENAWNKEYYNMQRQEYIKLNNAVGPNGSAYTHLDRLYLKRDGTNRKGVKVSDAAVAESYNGRMAALLEQMAPYKQYYNLENYFTEEDLAQIYPLLCDTDYTNSNIALQETDTAITMVQIEQELLDDCLDKVSELSQPQISFSSEIDNLYRIQEFKNLRKDLKLLNYIHLAIREDYVVKLRVVGVQWNPCDINDNLTLQFSNMITTRSGRSDFTDILDSQNNRGQKNSISVGANGQLGGSGENIEYLTNLMEALAGTGIFKKAVKNTVTNPISGVMNNVSEDEFMAAMRTVPGMSRFVLDTARASSLESDDVLIQGGKIKAGFLNAKYIAVNKIMSENYVPATSLDAYSNVGTLFDLTTGAISCQNFAVDADGNGFFRGTVTASKIIASVIKNAETDPTFQVTAQGKITTRNSAGTSETVINNGSITTNNITITGGSLNINDVFKVTSAGAMTATSGKIGYWNIDTRRLYNGSYILDAGAQTTTTINSTERKNLVISIGSRFGVDLSGNVYAHGATITGGSLNINDVFKVTTGGALTATSATVTGTVTATGGKIAGWNIDGNRLYNSTYILNAGGNTTTTINGTSRANLVLSIGSNFGVNTSGTLFANGVVLSGSITATSGTIGGCSIDSSGNLKIPTANITGTITANGININNGQFVVTTAGYMEANNSKIRGSISATVLQVDDELWLRGKDWGGGPVDMLSLKMIRNLWSQGNYLGSTLQIGNSSIHGVLAPCDIYSNGNIHGSKLYAGLNPAVISSGGQGTGYVSDLLVVENDGNPYAHFQTTQGGAYGVNVWTSDSSLKKDIMNSKVSALSAINAIRHRQFTWINNQRKQQLGYVAQELEEAIPKSTFEVDQGNSEKRLQINETIIIPYITKAIQEISDELDKLKEENKKLREIVQNLTGGENR